MYFSANFTTIEFIVFIDSHGPTINTTLLCIINNLLLQTIVKSVVNYIVFRFQIYCSTFFSMKKKELIVPLCCEV